MSIPVEVSAAQIIISEPTIHSWGLIWPTNAIKLSGMQTLNMCERCRSSLWNHYEFCFLSVPRVSCGHLRLGHYDQSVRCAIFRRIWVRVLYFKGISVPLRIVQLLSMFNLAHFDYWPHPCWIGDRPWRWALVIELTWPHWCVFVTNKVAPITIDVGFDTGDILER